LPQGHSFGFDGLVELIFNSGETVLEVAVASLKLVRRLCKFCPAAVRPRVEDGSLLGVLDEMVEVPDLAPFILHCFAAVAAAFGAVSGHCLELVCAVLAGGEHHLLSVCLKTAAAMLPRVADDVLGHLAAAVLDSLARFPHVPIRRCLRTLRVAMKLADIELRIAHFDHLLAGALRLATVNVVDQSGVFQSAAAHAVSEGMDVISDLISSCRDQALRAVPLIKDLCGGFLRMDTQKLTLKSVLRCIRALCLGVRDGESFARFFPVVLDTVRDADSSPDVTGLALRILAEMFQIIEDPDAYPAALEAVVNVLRRDRRDPMALDESSLFAPSKAEESAIACLQVIAKLWEPTWESVNGLLFAFMQEDGIVACEICLRLCVLYVMNAPNPNENVLEAIRRYVSERFGTCRTGLIVLGVLIFSRKYAVDLFPAGMEGIAAVWNARNPEADGSLAYDVSLALLFAIGGAAWNCDVGAALAFLMEVFRGEFVLPKLFYELGKEAITALVEVISDFEFPGQDVLHRAAMKFVDDSEDRL
jgi:hypothetical protein